jgi:hypothetical protein
MIARLRPAAAAALALALVAGPPVRAWDAGAHEIVAVIAYAHLNAKARAAADQLAPQLQSPARTYDAITAACWMDDLRGDPAMPDHGEFLSWHYIDLPIDPRDPVPPLEPGNDNDRQGDVVQALKRATVVLKGGTDPYVTSPAIAFAVVEHLVGDIHQPLHCATKYFFSHHELRNDKGGNDEFVLNGPPGDTRFNLHAFWDSAWRATFDETTGNVVLDPAFDGHGRHDPAAVRALADEFSRDFPPPAQAKLDPDFDAWAWESNGLARTIVYPGITVTDNRKYCRLGSAYVASARTLARRRLVLAGLRLATLLNATLGAAQPGPVPPSYPAGPASSW